MKKLFLLFALVLISASARAQVQPIQATLNSASTGACTPTSCLALTVPSGVGSASVSVVGSSGTVVFEVVDINGNYASLNVTPSTSSTQVSTATVTGTQFFQANIAGYSTFRVRLTASGSAAVVINPSTASARANGGGGGGGGVTSLTGDGTIITNSGSTGAVTLTADTQTGTGSIVLANTPSLTTPAIGAATGTSLNLASTGTLSTTAQSGTGSLCMTTNCAMTTPNLGTPSAVTLTNGTGYLLSALAAATSAPTLANGNNPQIWNWAQTSNTQAGITFGETSAATNGTLTSNLPNQSEVKISTASASTASPLSIAQGSVTGTVAFPALAVQTTWNNSGLAAQAIYSNVTNTSSGNGAPCNGGPALLRLDVGGACNFAVGKIGDLCFAGGAACWITGGGVIRLTNQAESSVFLPIITNTEQIYDGNSTIGNFGSNVATGATACETNFGATTLATGTTTTQTGITCIPANSIITAVVARVTTTITGSCTGWELGDGTTAARFTANNTNLTAGSTSVPLSGTAWTTGIASTTTGMVQAAATKITITCAGGNPSAGAIRVIVYAMTPTSPTS